MAHVQVATEVWAHLSLSSFTQFPTSRSSVRVSLGTSGWSLVTLERFPSPKPSGGQRCGELVGSPKILVWERCHLLLGWLVFVLGCCKLRGTSEHLIREETGKAWTAPKSFCSTPSFNCFPQKHVSLGIVIPGWSQWHLCRFQAPKHFGRKTAWLSRWSLMPLLLVKVGQVSVAVQAASGLFYVFFFFFFRDTSGFHRQLTVQASSSSIGQRPKSYPCGSKFDNMTITSIWKKGWHGLKIMENPWSVNGCGPFFSMKTKSWEW